MINIFQYFDYNSFEQKKFNDERKHNGKYSSIFQKNVQIIESHLVVLNEI